MSDTSEHMVASVTVDEVVESASVVSQRFYQKNRDIILIVGVVLVVLWINKRSLRSELKRLNFNVEVFPLGDDDFYS